MAMHRLSRTALLGLAMLSAASSVSAVSLSSFTPRINLLPPSCQIVYTSTIEGCKAEDFGANAKCSSACIQGMVKIAEAVIKSCVNVDVGETSIIGVFQHGIGIQALCPGVSSVTTIVSNTATSTKATQTSTQATTATTTSTSTTSTSTSTKATTSASQSGATESSSTTTQAIATDPRPTSVNNPPPTNVAQPPPAPPPLFTMSSVGASATKASQLSNADSGGGSPFDVTATGSSTQLRVLDVTMVAFLASAFLFVACA